MGIDVLQSIVNLATPIAFNVYDQLEVEGEMELFAMIFDNTLLLDDPVKFEWVGQFWKAQEWIDERSTQKIVRGDFAIKNRLNEITIEFDRLDYQRPGSVAKAIDPLEGMATSFFFDKLDLALQVFRENPKSYDGKPLFATNHKHPGTKQQPYSNLLAAEYADPAKPTHQELATVLRQAFERLVSNGAVRRPMVRMDKLDQNLLVFAHSETYASILNELATSAEIEGTSNPYKDRFTVIFDAWAGDAIPDHIHVVYSSDRARPVRTDDGERIRVTAPKPVIFVLTDDPKEIEMDESSQFKNRNILLGMHGQYNAGPGWPQTAVRIAPAGG